MSRCFLGVDTSNYTTSVALVDGEGRVVFNGKKPLDVGLGERGLRQSDAVFAHTKNLPELFELIRGAHICAVGVSASPRDAADSYMPCFLAGVSAASSVACALDLPLYRFSHQRGHLRAALYSARREERIGKRFAAFHVSGGTTEILLVENGEIIKIGGTLDLNAGQAIDRAGVAFGLKFPCGAELSKIAEVSSIPQKPRVCVNGLECNFSGLENKVLEMISAGADKSAVAGYVIEFVKLTLDKLCSNLLEAHPGLDVVFSGGVTSNRYIAAFLAGKYGASFAEPEFSSDNAAGTALLAYDRYLKGGNNAAGN